MSVRASDVPAGASAEELLESLERPVAAAVRTPVRAALAGRLALVVLALCSLAVVFVAAGQPTILVPQSTVEFPGWYAGPLHLLARGFPLRADPTAVFFSVALAPTRSSSPARRRCAPAPSSSRSSRCTRSGCWRRRCR